MKHRVGDTVVIVGDHGHGHDFVIGEKVTVTTVDYDGVDYHVRGTNTVGGRWIREDECEAYQETIPMEITSMKHKASDKLVEAYQDTPITQDATGGPSLYYDMPYATWVTTNDQMEYLAEHKWGKYAIHLKDIFKGLCRWGDKQGTTPSYDARKIIYYGLRVLMMLEGKANVQQYLSDLKNDPQFKENK